MPFAGSTKKKISGRVSFQKNPINDHFERNKNWNGKIKFKFGVVSNFITCLREISLQGEEDGTAFQPTMGLVVY